MAIGMATYTTSPVASRLTSVDAYRGFVMICLAADGFGLKDVAKKFPNSQVWKAIGHQFEHEAWVGCAFWDLIQPSFMFLVGVALPYSYSRRAALGESSTTIIRHVLVRSLVLVLLGLFLSSGRTPTTNFSFMNVLTQIGLGYSILYFLHHRNFSIQIAVAIGLLAGYWSIFAMTPTVPIGKPEIDELPPNWVMLEGFEAHWQKHENVAAHFDRWFLNVFPAAKRPLAPGDSNAVANEGHKPATGEAEDDPGNHLEKGFLERLGLCFRRLVTRPEPYVFNSGGYQTLNFIPSIVTMLFGVMAGQFIRGESQTRARTFAWLLLAGLTLLGLGWVWQYSGYCPLVKRIWTPSWTLFSTGWTLLMLSGFYGIIDVLGWKAWSFPLVVAGMNSMVLYLFGQLLPQWVSTLLKRHINDDLFLIFGDNYVALVEKSLVVFFVFGCLFIGSIDNEFLCEFDANWPKPKRDDSLTDSLKDYWKFRLKNKRTLVGILAADLLFLSALFVLGGQNKAESEPGLEAVEPKEFYRSFAGENDGQLFDTNGLKMPFIWCSPGRFEMGDFGDDDATTDKSGKPKPDITVPARVLLEKGFWLGRYEVTQSEWVQVMTTEPWKGKQRIKSGNDFPATYVHYDDALEFCRQMSVIERRMNRLPNGWEYTLPTEAEWERGCRARTTSRYSFGNDQSKLGDYAWTAENASFIGEAYAHQIGQKKENPWGLFDMHGNVAEWCRDEYDWQLPGGRNPEPTGTGFLRVLRGGSYHDQVPRCRSAMRQRGERDFRGPHVGFRVALSFVKPSRTRMTEK